MISRIATAAVLIAGLAGAVLCSAEVAGQDSPAALVTRVPARYPAKAIERGQEGWVDVSFTVTPEGTTSAIRVVAQYPKHVFGRSAVNTVMKWTYRPRLENGVAVPQAGNHELLRFALADSTSLRDSVAGPVAAARDAIAQHNWQTAQQLIDQLDASEPLKLFELAVLEELRGRIAWGQNNYDDAATHFGRALAITPHLPADTRDTLSEGLIVAELRSGQYQRAVDAFDAWTTGPADERKVLRRVIESVRAALAAGRQVVVDPATLPDLDE